MFEYLYSLKTWLLLSNLSSHKWVDCSVQTKVQRRTISLDIWKLIRFLLIQIVFDVLLSVATCCSSKIVSFIKKFLFAIILWSTWNLSLLTYVFCVFWIGMHGYPANYLLSGQIVAFFTICICICIRRDTSLLSVSVSGQQMLSDRSIWKN